MTDLERQSTAALFAARRHRIALTKNGIWWHWEVEYESNGSWFRVGLVYDRMEGWSLTRLSALRRASRKLNRYLRGMDRFLMAHREQVEI